MSENKLNKSHSAQKLQYNYLRGEKKKSKNHWNDSSYILIKVCEAEDPVVCKVGVYWCRCLLSYRRGNPQTVKSRLLWSVEFHSKIL